MSVELRFYSLLKSELEAIKREREQELGSGSALVDKDPAIIAAKYTGQVHYCRALTDVLGKMEEIQTKVTGGN